MNATGESPPYTTFVARMVLLTLTRSDGVKEPYPLMLINPGQAAVRQNMLRARDNLACQLGIDRRRHR